MTNGDTLLHPAENYSTTKGLAQELPSQGQQQVDRLTPDTRKRIRDQQALETHLLRRGKAIIRAVIKNGEALQLGNLQIAVAFENEASGTPPLTLRKAVDLATRLYLQSVTEETAVPESLRKELYSNEPIKLRSPHEYLVGTNSATQEGWFPRGEISAIAGPSGGGKTRWLIDLIQKIKAGESMFGRPVMHTSYLFLSYDRSKRSFERTLQSMNLPLDEITFYRPMKDEAQKDAATFLPLLLYRPEYRDVGVVIIEGADMKVPKGKINDLGEVSNYIDTLQRLAERMGLHLIVTLGTGKMKANERYLSLRERIIGSTAWGRKLETIVYIEPDENDENTRRLTILTRNATSENHRFAFENGRLVETGDKSARDRLEKWISTELNLEQVFTLEQATQALKDPKSTVESALKQLVRLGKVAKLRHGTYHPVTTTDSSVSQTQSSMTGLEALLPPEPKII